MCVVSTFSELTESHQCWLRRMIVFFIAVALALEYFSVSPLQRIIFDLSDVFNTDAIRNNTNEQTTDPPSVSTALNTDGRSSKTPNNIQSLQNSSKKAFYDSDLGENARSAIELRSLQIKLLCEKHISDIQEYKSSLQQSKVYMTVFNQQPRVIVDDRTHLAVCVQAKAGSTFWKNVMTLIHKQSPSRRNPGPLRYITTTEFIGQVDKNAYTSFVFGRDPWSRLVSLYRQKVETKDTSDKAYTYIKTACGGDSVDTFQDFLSCVVRTWKLGLPDRHWEPVTSRCDICSINYTYIGKFENMNAEAAEILSEKVPHIKELLSTSRNSTMRVTESHIPHKDYRDYYIGVPENLLEQLTDIYRYDIQLFQFPDDPWTN